MTSAPAGRKTLATLGPARPPRPRRRPVGLHRLGTPGTVPRYPAGPPRPPGRRRPRHHLATRPSRLATRAATVLGLVATLLVSGWFTLAGATALAQGMS